MAVDNKLDASETLRRCEAAVSEARAFFGIDPLWETPIYANHQGGAKITCDIGYYHAPIQVELDWLQEKPHLIREIMAHEVAHIMSAEINRLRSVLPPEYRDRETPQGLMFHDAMETLTVRLDKLFLRERPAAGGET